jgi:AcrR family transcriptional regulator
VRVTIEPGLRARKNERTRQAIERAALELALEQGYDHTTVDQIAARAEVAPRTIYSRYATKDTIVFGDDGEVANRFRAWLETNGPDLVGGLIAWVHESLTADRDDNSELERLRLRAMLEDPYLRRGLRGRFDEMEHEIATKIAAGLRLSAEATGPQVFAAAVSGLLLALIRRAVRDPEFDARTECADGLAVLTGAHEALQRLAAAPDRRGGPDADPAGSAS